MKKLKSLKLNQFSKSELERREMKFLLGGGTPGDCVCGCPNNNTNANCNANADYGYTKGSGHDDEYDNCCSCESGEYIFSFVYV